MPSRTDDHWCGRAADHMKVCSALSGAWLVICALNTLTSAGSSVPSVNKIEQPLGLLGTISELPPKAALPASSKSVLFPPGAE